MKKIINQFLLFLVFKFYKKNIKENYKRTNLKEFRKLKGFKEE